MSNSVLCYIWVLLFRVKCYRCEGECYDYQVMSDPNELYRCVECGEMTNDLYKHMKAGIIKVSFCVKCGEVTDKYILCDPVIMLLDALLHKPQVYRHLLHNIFIPSLWKLSVIFLLCDTYLKWDNLHSNGNGYHGNGSPDAQSPIFYAALEVDFYRMSCVAILELVCFTVLLYVAVKGLLDKTVSMKELAGAVVVSSFGKLLTIPAIIWGQTHSTIYLWLTQLFVLTSNITALRVLCSSARLKTMCVVVGAWGSQYVIGNWIMNQLISS